MEMSRTPVLPSRFVSKTTYWVLIKCGILGLHWKLLDEFNFGRISSVRLHKAREAHRISYMRLDD
jgi:hypothetical protein